MIKAAIKLVTLFTEMSIRTNIPKKALNVKLNQ